MSAFLSFFYLGIMQLHLLQPNLYYDAVLVPKFVIPAGVQRPSGLEPVNRSSASGFSAGIFVPNYRRCFENQDPSGCANLSDYRPQLEMGWDKWKLGAKIDSDEVKLRLKIPLQ